MSGAFRRKERGYLLSNYRVQKDGTVGFDLFGSKILSIGYYHFITPAQSSTLPVIKSKCAKKVIVPEKNKKKKKPVRSCRKFETGETKCANICDEKLINPGDPLCDFKLSSSGNCGYSKIKCARCQYSLPSYGKKGYKPKYCGKCARFVNSQLGTNYEYICRTYAWDVNDKNKDKD